MGVLLWNDTVPGIGNIQLNETMITAPRSREFSRKSREVNGQRGYSVIRTLMEEN